MSGSGDRGGLIGRENSGFVDLVGVGMSEGRYVRWRSMDRKY